LLLAHSFGGDCLLFRPRRIGQDFGDFLAGPLRGILRFPGVCCEERNRARSPQNSKLLNGFSLHLLEETPSTPLSLPQAEYGTVEFADIFS
jgi:hypothetical protein